MSKASTQEGSAATLSVWIDGQTVPAEKAMVSVFDRGFLYGDSVFETLRTYKREPFALQLHLHRLQESANKVYIEMPVPLEQLAEEVTRAICESAFDECYVRVMLTRGRGELGLDPGQATMPLRVILVGPSA